MDFPKHTSWKQAARTTDPPSNIPGVQHLYVQALYIYIYIYIYIDKLSFIFPLLKFSDSLQEKN